MKAVTFQGTKDIQVEEIADPLLQKRDDIIVRITSTYSLLEIYSSVMYRSKWLYITCR